MSSFIESSGDLMGASRMISPRPRVSEEEARKAGSMFFDVCTNQMLKHIGLVECTYDEDCPEADLYQSFTFPNAENSCHVLISSRDRTTDPGQAGKLALGSAPREVRIAYLDYSMNMPVGFHTFVSIAYDPAKESACAIDNQPLLPYWAFMEDDDGKLPAIDPDKAAHRKVTGGPIGMREVNVLEELLEQPDLLVAHPRSQLLPPDYMQSMAFPLIASL